VNDKPGPQTGSPDDTALGGPDRSAGSTPKDFAPTLDSENELGRNVRSHPGALPREKETQRETNRIFTPSAATAPHEDSPAAEQSRDAVPSRVRRILLAPVKLFLGMAFCQSAIGALAVLGWTYRLMQRSVLKQWWQLGARSEKGDRFEDFLAGVRTREHVHWPNWFFAQNFGETIRSAWLRDRANDLRASEPGRSAVCLAPVPSREGAGVSYTAGQRSTAGRSRADRVLGNATLLLRAIISSLWSNIRLGVHGIMNTWVLTLPPCVLMLFGWYDGWNNSFNKGYEQFHVGPAVSWLGILLFIASMCYVPMAQARQAVTGNWRSFYQFRLALTLVRRRWLACFGLATLYALCSVPMMILGSVVMFLPNLNPALGELTPAQAVQVLNRYYFWSALFVFTAFVMLRLVAARIYGSTLLKAVQTGAFARDALGEIEWQVLQRLDLLRLEPPRRRHPALRIVTWAGTRAGRVTFGLLTFLAWLTFVAQLYVAQFFNYRGPHGWLNQPLVQLPWFHHLPVTLKNPWGDVIAAAAIVFVAWRLRRFAIWLASRNLLQM